MKPLSTIETEHRTLLQNILNRPESDTERLIYANFLVNYGDSQLGQYIELSIECVNSPSCNRYHDMMVCDCVHCKLSRLLQIYTPVTGITVIGVPVWERGFIKKISLTMDSFFVNIKGIFENHPVTEITFTDRISVDNTWVREVDTDDSFILPKCLFGYVWDQSNKVGRHARFDNVFLANEAVSKSAIRYGRSICKLSELEY